MDAKTNALAILEGIKKAGIDLITSLPDINCLDLINALERDSAIEHVPLCREEEGVGNLRRRAIGWQETGDHHAERRPVE